MKLTNEKEVAMVNELELYILFTALNADKRERREVKK
jgi:hypothetical protein